MRTKEFIKIFAVALCVLFTRDASSQNDSEVENKYSLSYGNKGWRLASSDGVNSMNFELRLQFRYSYPFEQDPVTLSQINSENQHILQIRRARMKIGGNAFTPKLEYYMEYELANSSLLDFWAIYSFSNSFKIMAGQYKARYNTARVISSGKQQTADRSILTRPFTIDRQTGLTLFGNLKGTGSLNLSYWLSIFNGTGRGASVKDDEKIMYMTRLQWNPFGKELKFVGSNLTSRDTWQGYIAGGGVMNTSGYTRFSQSGGGQLGGYPEENAPGRYEIKQVFFETVWQKSGFSWIQEFHWKEINDLEAQDTRVLKGGYVQFGTFPESYIKWFPEPLELAARYAQYQPSTTSDWLQQEFTITSNWFFSGHRNKLSVEGSYLHYRELEVFDDGWRVRFQWEVSF